MPKDSRSKATQTAKEPQQRNSKQNLRNMQYPIHSKHPCNQVLLQHMQERSQTQSRQRIHTQMASKNPERNAERRKREDRELCRQRTHRWRKQHPEKAKAQAKAYRQANRASESERVRRWLEDPEHKERHYANIKRWAVRNPDKVAAYRVRRARAELDGNATRELINTKCEASNKTCCLCGTRIDDTLRSPHPMSLSLEHLTPISRGGRHDIDNIDFAHRTCNTKKGTKTLDEFREWMNRAA
mgnify:CR=1 FL=1